MTRSMLDRHVANSAIDTLGNIVVRADIQSSLGPFRTLPDYIIRYPKVVIEAMSNLYDEYNRAFAPLVAANREWETDYQYCMPGGVPINWFVQIDMVGLPEAFLQEAAEMPEEIIREILRTRIFEIENSVAMYQLLENLFSRNGRDSFFKTRFRTALGDLRQQLGKPIALLAVAKEKYNAMLESEFGKYYIGEELTDAEVGELSGFDYFFGPKEFLNHFASSGGQCEYLLYVRASDPVSKLKNPRSSIMHPLLIDSEMRRIIKQNTLTFNIDDPKMGYERRINDTKEYMTRMGMAFQIRAMTDLRSSEFESFLRAQGFDRPKTVMLRCKPAKGAYGAYGHIARIMYEGSKALARGLDEWGDYVVQPEMATPVITDTTDGTAYTFIDRNFFGMVNGRPKFLGGVRNLMPVDTPEARKRRIHGNASAVYAEIVC